MLKTIHHIIRMSNDINCDKCLKLVPFTNFCQNCGTKLPKISKCPICLDEKLLKIINCGHGICLECFKITYKMNKSCPLCRTDIEDDYEIIDSSSEYEEFDEERQEIYENTIIHDNDNEIIFVCCECYSKNIKNLNNDKLKIYYCDNCEKTIDNCIQLYKQDYDYKIYKVKDKKHLNKIKICSNCNSKEILIRINEFNIIEKNCLHCKKINPITRLIYKHEYNVGINKLEFHNSII